VSRLKKFGDYPYFCEQKEELVSQEGRKETEEVHSDMFSRDLQANRANILSTASSSFNPTNCK
jgi:hypothetical protein